MAASRLILDRKGFIDYWVDYMKTHTDAEWSRQQNVLINSVLKTVKQPSAKEYMERKKKC
ncbi:hypothetical protein HYU21_04290 [Candidatus Woesearchaeota archaeon]|nr:hypothetical protein [Candidatus Woesearchaeota archaeon]